MKKLIVVLLLALTLTGCNGKIASAPIGKKDGPRFVKLSDEGTFEVYVDTVTDIQYAVSDSLGNMGTVTLLVDKNGYPLLWKGEGQMFEVGQKVVHVNNCGYGRRIGTVIAITEKRHDIKVDFDTYRATYRGDGVSRGSDPWLREYITPLTPEIAEKINHKNKVSKCGKLLNAVYKKVDSLTDGQLDDIISVLSEVE